MSIIQHNWFDKISDSSTKKKIDIAIQNLLDLITYREMQWAMCMDCQGMHPSDFRGRKRDVMIAYYQFLTEVTGLKMGK